MYSDSVRNNYVYAARTKAEANNSFTNDINIFFFKYLYRFKISF